MEPPSATPRPPTLARSSPFLQLWYKQDQSFKVGALLVDPPPCPSIDVRRVCGVYAQQPRACIVLDLLTPLVQRDPTLAELLVRYIDHALAESTYDATLAGKFEGSCVCLPLWVRRIGRHS